MMYVTIYSTEPNDSTCLLQEGKDAVLSVSQKKFCADSTASSGEDTIWQVPVTVKVQGRTGVEKFLVDKKEMEFRLQEVEPERWIKVCSSTTHTVILGPRCEMELCAFCAPIHCWGSLVHWASRL